MSSPTCSICKGALPKGHYESPGHTALCAMVLAGEAEKYRKALEQIRDMMGPENRQRFVMQGPRAFLGLYNVVEAALK